MRQHHIKSSETSKFAFKWDGPGIILDLPSNSDDNEPWHGWVLDLKKRRVTSVPIHDLKTLHLREESKHDAVAKSIEDLQEDAGDWDDVSRNIRCRSPTIPTASADRYDVETLFIGGDDSHVPLAETSTDCRVIDLDGPVDNDRRNLLIETRASKRKQAWCTSDPPQDLSKMPTTSEASRTEDWPNTCS